MPIQILVQISSAGASLKVCEQLILFTRNLDKVIFAVLDV